MMWINKITYTEARVLFNPLQRRKDRLLTLKIIICVRFVKMFLNQMDDDVYFPPVVIRELFSLYLFSFCPTKMT